MMKRAGCVTLVLLLLIVVVAAWIVHLRARDWARLKIEASLSQAIGLPCTVASLDWQLLALRANLATARCGPEPGLFVLPELIVQADLWASIEERRPVLTVRVTGAAIDLTQLPKPQPHTEMVTGESRSLAVPSLRIAGFFVQDLLFRFPYDPRSVATVSVDSLEVTAETGLRGVLTGDIALVGAVFEHKGKVMRVHAARTRAQWDRDHGLSADWARIDGEGLSASLTRETTAQFHAQLQFTPELLGAFVEELVFLQGNGVAEGTLTGDLANPVVEASVHLARGALAGRPIGDLTTRFERRGATLSFRDTYIQGDSGSAAGDVTLVIHKEVPISGELRLRDVVLRNVLTRSGETIDFPTLLNGKVDLKGQLDPLDLHITGKGEAAAPESSAAAALWEATVRAQPHAVDIAANAAQGANNRAVVNLAIAADRFEGKGMLHADDLSTLRGLLPVSVADLALSGRGDVDVTFAGTPEHPRVHAAIRGTTLTVLGSPIPDLGGEVRIAEQKLITDSLQIRSRAGNLSFAGTLALDTHHDNDFRVSANAFDVDVATPLLRAFAGYDLPISGGALDGEVTARGRWPDLQAALQLRAATVRLWREPLREINLHGNWRQGRWDAGVEIQHAANEWVALRGRGVGWRESEIDLDSSPIAVGNLVGAGQNEIDGTLRLRGQLHDDVRTPRGSLSLTLDSLSIRRRSVGGITVSLDAAPERWLVRADAAQQGFELAATLQPRATVPFEATLRWNESDLAVFLPIAAGAQMITSGSAQLSGTLVPLYIADGQIVAPRLDITRDTYAVRTAAPVRMRFDRGVLRIDAFELISGETRLRLDGNIGIDGSVDVKASGAGDLVLLEVLGPPVLAARGPFSVRVTARHDTRGWQLDGEAQLTRGSLDVGLPAPLTETSARLRLSGSRVSIEDLEGKAGGGAFSVHGEIDADRGVELIWQLQDVGMNLADNLEARAGGKGMIRGAWNAMQLDGDIEVTNALYDRDLGFNDLLDWLKRQLQPRGQVQRSEASALRLNVRIYSRGGVFMDNNLGKGEMWLDLLLAGNTARPQLTGRIGILDAEITLRGRTFTVTAGTIDFRDPQHINPILNITAESRVTTTETDYLVNVIVTGTAENPRLQFSADDPSLTQNDVLSLVTFGKTRSQAQRENSSLNPTAAALALLPTSGVEKKVGEFLGLDRFEVTATQARDTGNIEPRVSVGKEITQKLRALAWTSVGVQARQAVQIEYRWTRRVSLLGSWESQTQSSAGAFGGDVKFRLEYRRVPLFLTEEPVRAEDVLPR